MKIIKFFFLLIFLVVISTFSSYLFYNYFIIEKVIALDMMVKVDDHFGLNADGDAIKFGRIMPGTSSERLITVNNNATHPLKVVISKSGYIADWVGVSENNFVLKEKESKNVLFKVSAPENANYGNYTGKVEIIFKRALFGK